MAARQEHAVGVLSLGAHVPETVVTNEMIADWTSVRVEWIARATGILERRYAPRGQSTSSLAEPAAKEALAGASGPVDALVFATATPDQFTPPTATALQHLLGLSGSAAFDVNAACGGFVYGLALAHGLILSVSGIANVLVVGADQYSKVVNRADRTTAPIFGDGAGAVMLGEVPEGFGIKAVSLAAYGEHQDEVGIFAGGTREPLTPESVGGQRATVHMNGRVVRRLFIEKVSALTRQVADEAGWTLGDVDRFVFHQGNPVMLREVADALGVEAARVGETASVLGNTGCASVPLTLHHLHRVDPLRRGERLIVAGAGAGLTAGAVALVWW
ncbi:ketoacyl-ACP synthase III [Streptomyces sp. TRM66268-LWL]|uniref:Ketoacyl-ACP synthase III n=1 Tax=Streptomyces polyasparticus TaxID=2767826 RepID=A0ABR7SYB1_9ACTN|nr:ketoacyl-ACP synthase III [Streptomyces polyasparticus]MBC9719637.1 ketoacyl-ACP synthase III [Streptomyces polyasparticus]